MKITIDQAAKLCGISASLLRQRIERHKVLKVSRTRPATVLLSDVLLYRKSCAPPKAPGGRPTSLAKLGASLDQIIGAASHSTSDL